MKLKRIFSAFLAYLMLSACVLVCFNASVSAADSTLYENYHLYKYDSDVCTTAVEIVNDGTATITSGNNIVNYFYPGINITPNVSGNPDLPLAIKYTDIDDKSIAFEDVDFIRINYYYTGSRKGRAMLKFKKDDFNLTQDLVVYSMDIMKSTKSAGATQFITFDVKEIAEGYIFEGGILPEFEFYPFGDTPSGELDASKDVVGITDIVIGGKGGVVSTNSTTGGVTLLKDVINHKYPIYFLPGRADATGTAPETEFVAVGGSVKLPECTFELEGYEFAGWLAANGNDTYQPGDRYTVVKRSIDGYQTGRMYFLATWEKKADYEDVNIASSSTFFTAFVTPTTVNGVSGKPGIKFASKFVKNYNFDGVNTVQFKFYPSESDADRSFSLDCYTWNALPLDIAKYKYVAIPYYYKTSTNTVPSETPRLSFNKNGSTCLKSDTTVTSTAGKIVANKWAVMTFEFDFTNENSPLYKNFNADADSTVINHTHFQPFGNRKNISQLFDEGDEFYLGDFILFEEVPSSAPILNRQFIDGYDDNGDGKSNGHFRPTQTITNAEAVAMLVKAMGAFDDVLSGYTETSYSDITDEHWAYNYVCYLESIGVLKPDALDSFNAESAADRLEFVKQVVIAKGANADSEAAAMLLASNEKTLSRSDAVNIINSLYFDKHYDLGDVEPLFEKFFNDVSPEQWFYQDIVLAAMPTISYKDANGKDRVAGVYENALEVPDSFAEDAVAYVNELDRITAERIAAIRATDSDYKVKAGGKIIYLSSSTGSASNAGTLESKPKKIKTLEEVTALNLNPGDVVLFKRGDIFRGRVEAQPGVTYSAWGNGEKPILTRSPENGADSSKWTLDYEDKTTGKKIWKYENENLIDVGAIMLMTGSGSDPRKYEHTVAYKEVPSYRGKATLKNGTTKQYEGYYVRGYLPGENSEYPDGKVFNYVDELDRDLEFFHDTNDAGNMTKPTLSESFKSKTGIASLEFPNIDKATGPLYLRCDAGNPGSVYDEIEFNIRSSVLAVGTDNAVTIDNLCFMYFGTHGVSASTCNNLTVRNCEIGWGGGTIQNYNTSNASNPGFVTRLGNGVEVYGGCRNYHIDNCYVYQIYDAGITHQFSTSETGNCFMEGVYYTNNVLEDSIYNIEYFLGLNDSKPDLIKLMKDIVFDGNICRRAGYGWGVQRPDANQPSNIRAGGSHNLASDYVIRNNVFDRTVDFAKEESRISSADSNLRINTGFLQCSIPYLENNIHVQSPGRIILEYGNSRICGIRSEQDFIDIGGVSNTVYMYPDDFDEYVDKHILYQPPEY